MAQWIFTLSVLNVSDVAETLYFSDVGYVDAGENYYEVRIVTPALVNISPNDGGVLGIFDSASVGDIELENADGGLNYLASYAIDGRAAVLSYVDGDTVTEYYRGVVTKMAESDGRITLSLKAPHDVLTDNFTMAIYAGNNVLPVGLEGTADDIKDNVKPQVFGDCRNISATLVNASLLIYQASSRADCMITAVYDEGVRLINYQANGIHYAADTNIAVHNGIGDIPAGAKIVFSNHSTIYTVTAGLTAGVVEITPGLTQSIVNGAVIEQVNFYTDTTDLQSADYQVNGAHAVGVTTVALYAGIGAVTTGDFLIFSNHLAIYTLAAGLSGGHVVLSAGLLEKLNGDEFVHIIGLSPALWGAYQGYFRLSYAPLGTVTCDAVSVSRGVVRKAGDVFNDVATAAGLTVDSASVTELNAAGTIGLYIDTQTTISDLLDKIIKSVAGYYHIASGTLYGNLLQAPTNSPIFTIEDYQIKSLNRQATGLGENGLTLKAIHVLYDRIETVQDSIAGGVSAKWRERLKKQYREITSTDSATATRHPLAVTLEIESLLRSGVTTLINRVLAIIKARRDVVTVEAVFTELPAFLIGDTVNITTPRLGYDSDRNMVIISSTIDIKAKTITLRLYG